MEFPAVGLLPLPGPATRIVTEFLRAPHPTAELIKDLEFVWESEDELSWLIVRGKDLRCIDNSRADHPPKYDNSECDQGWEVQFVCDRTDGKLLRYIL